ncbi:hypothetical protein [Nonomuraea rubra]|uniref:Uncharacterized protein n=1 Tax=Nonomuraea rubra TaxID=46180 RepID=A0A7X0U068_9ACTN|nr:hypothetical protein [Nonomuraea rubra]MBB6550442.1 hypothetical protein [Nonomuraea rubra]
MTRHPARSKIRSCGPGVRVLGYQAEYAEEPPALSPTFEQVTGRKGRTLAPWAADHAAELAPDA